MLKGDKMKCGSWLKPHDFCIAGSLQQGVMAWCSRCNLRTPIYPWQSGASAKELFKRAERENPKAGGVMDILKYTEYSEEIFFGLG